MKLIDILARKLTVWPERDEQTVAFMCVRHNGRLFGYSSEGNPVWANSLILAEDFAEDEAFAVVCRIQWQAAVDALAAQDMHEVALGAEPGVTEPDEEIKSKRIVRSNDELAALVASKTIYRFGNLFWGDVIRRKDLVGKIAGSVSSTDGYRYVKCGKGKKRVAVHRVVFLMHHGYLPEVIDHINRIRDDNRIENLRDALTEGNNQGNQSHQAGRSSKYKGVCWDSARSKWSAYAKQAGKRWYLGRFSSEDQAALAYNEKAKELFGDFANLNVIRTAEQIANDRLIAAAPDLLDAAEKTMAWWNDAQYWTTGEMGEYNLFDEDPEFVIAARAAIAKAKGEAQ